MSAANLSSLADVFSGATVSNGAVTIPSGSIVSYVPASVTSPSGAEGVFGVLETLSRAVAGATGINNLSVSTNSSVLDNGATLRKSFSFTCSLALTSGIYESLNLK
jgi:hypothetical protein